MGSQAGKRRVSAYLQKAENEKSAYDYKAAAEAYEKALQIDPNLAKAHFELGLLYDNDLEDPVSAVYHYQHYKKLTADSKEKKAFINPRITRCKRELAKGVSLAPVTQDIQKHLQSVKQENTALKKERDKLLERVNQLEDKLRQAKAQIERLKAGPGAGTGVEVSESGGSHGSGSEFGYHTVKRNETMYQIKEQYGITLKQLMEANPNVNPRRMRKGTRLKIPYP